MGAGIGSPKTGARARARQEAGDDGRALAAGPLSDRVTARAANQQLTPRPSRRRRLICLSASVGARVVVRRGEGLPRSRSHHPMGHGRGAQRPGDKPACVCSSRWSFLERPRQRPSPQGNLLDSCHKNKILCKSNHTHILEPS